MAKDIQSLLSSIARSNVSTAVHFRSMVENVIEAATYETGGKLSYKSLDVLKQISSAAQAAGASRAEAMAPYFSKVRDWAKSVGAPNTAAAVVSAASWFYNNVELPAQQKASGGGTFIPSSPADTELLVPEEATSSWVTPVLIAGGVALVGALAFFLWPRSSAKS